MLDTREINVIKSKVNKQINKQKEQTKCVLCGREIKNEAKSFHKSHTIPHFCLENIKGIYGKNYGVLNGNYVCLTTPFDDKVLIGTNKAGVFYSICSTCDQDKFKIYENEGALLSLEPKYLVDSIALKIYLNELFNTQLRYFKTTINYSGLTDDQMISSFYEHKHQIEKSTIALDVKDFLDDLNFAKRSFDKGYSNYRIIYHTILNYTVPIAAQASIPVSRNVDGSKLQDVTLINKKRIEDLLVCVFPLKDKSVILLFSRIDNKLIKQYAKQFNKLSEADKLKEIFYLLIRYKSSNYFFSPLLKDVLLDKSIKRVASIEDAVFGFGEFSMNIADFETPDYKQELLPILNELYSIQCLNVNGQ